MERIKKFTESNGNMELRDATQSFKDVCSFIGVDEKWLIEYMIDCFEYDLDIDTTEYSLDEISSMIVNMKSIRRKLRK